MTKRWMSSPWRGPVVAAGAAALVFAASGTAQAAPANAKKKAADVAVELNADPAIIPVGGGTTITATVQNQGARPARDVRLRITMPPGFHVWQTTTSSTFPCTLSGQVMTCESSVDLAPHTAMFPVGIELSAATEHPGTVADFTASVSTGSREPNKSNNTATRTVQIVGVGTVQGNVWNDLNGDGQRESGEPPLNDISSIELLSPGEDTGGAFIGNIFNGFYSFSGQAAAPYFVRVRLNSVDPWTFTTPNVGDDATDSDVTDVSEDGSLPTADSAASNVVAGGVVTIDIGLVAKPQ